jgi:hypothetical protein
MFEVRGSAQGFHIVIGELGAEHFCKPFAKLFARKLARGPLAGGKELQAVRFLPSEVFDLHNQVVRRSLRDAYSAARQCAFSAPQVQKRAASLGVDFVLEVRERSKAHTVLADFNRAAGGKLLKRPFEFGGVHHKMIIEELLQKSVIFLAVYCS